MPIVDYIVQNGSSTGQFSGMLDSIVFLSLWFSQRVHRQRKALDEPTSGLSATLPQLGYLRTRFDANAIIDGRTNSLFAAKIALRRLDGYVPQKKLNLIELTSRSVAQPSAGPTQIVRRQCGDAGRPCRFLHDVPNRFFRDGISPRLADLIYPAEHCSSINSSRNQPIVQFASHPIGNRNSSNMTTFASQIHNCPMLLTLLKMIESQSHSFVPP